MYFILVNSFIGSSSPKRGTAINYSVDIKAVVVALVILTELLNEPMGGDHSWMMHKSTPTWSEGRVHTQASSSRICAFKQARLFALFPVVLELFLPVASICNAMKGLHPVLCVRSGPRSPVSSQNRGIWSFHLGTMRTTLTEAQKENCSHHMVCWGFSLPSFLLTHWRVLGTLSFLPEGLRFGCSSFPACLMEQWLPVHGEYNKHLLSLPFSLWAQVRECPSGGRVEGRC